MIKVKHPITKFNTQQEEFINKCPANKKRFYELIFSYGNATIRYHSEADSNLSIVDYDEWLDGLEKPMKKAMLGLGFERCKSVLSFTRYVQEKNDVGMEEYIRNLMGNDEYNNYLEVTEGK